jgi:isopentenyldiphosphate isomerase
MINFMLMTEVILVDERDTPLGTMEKMEAHRKGILHRAFSIFIFNDKGEMLLQKRAMDNTIMRAFGPMPAAVTLTQARTF